MVMMREQMRILWKKTEQMGRESSVHSAMFEVHPLPVYEEDPYQCGWRIVPSPAESAEPVAAGARRCICRSPTGV